MDSMKTTTPKPNEQEQSITSSEIHRTRRQEVTRLIRQYWGVFQLLAILLGLVILLASLLFSKPDQHKETADSVMSMLYKIATLPAICHMQADASIVVNGSETQDNLL